MKISQTMLLAGVFIFVLIIAVAVLSNAPGKYDDFAKCLSSKGAKMYGASWCPHCNDQKKMFGSSWKYMDYVECSTPDGTAQTQVCIDAGIKSYPTWEFKNGTRVNGVLTFEELGAKTGCPAGN
ncbi:MAG: hypothetical protein U0R44_00735 [Candidatus Micrarchaeia archaeon]